MRFGVLGPVSSDFSLLEKAARLLLFEHDADEVIYLGPDDALDRVVLDWASRLVGSEPSQDGVWDRAAERCGIAGHAEIDRFIAAERERKRLEALKCLPLSTSRTVEIFDGRVAIFLYDKGLLDEEDILPATLLVFGKSREPLVRQVGSRTFVTPGELGGGPGGVALFREDPGGELTVSFFAPSGAVLATHPISTARAAKMRVLDKTTTGEPR